MNPKHTPGPWALRPNAGEPQAAIEVYTDGSNGSRKLSTLVVAGNESIADCLGAGAAGYSLVIRHANARLIAAAPEMLDVLRITLGNIMSVGPAGHLDDVPMEFREWAAVVSRAIAKAEGTA